MKKLSCSSPAAIRWKKFQCCGGHIDEREPGYSGIVAGFQFISKYSDYQVTEPSPVNCIFCSHTFGDYMGEEEPLKERGGELFYGWINFCEWNFGGWVYCLSTVGSDFLIVIASSKRAWLPLKLQKIYCFRA